jgi:putative colanic acid biosynthesis UDP-glucose lipid carrier transferase|tara:strand:+ start:907 stop:1497 length:591 start_codon:yes stop_codon:yes gene_type:complete
MRGYDLLFGSLNQLFALLLIIVLMPLFLIVAIIIIADSKGSVMYSQKRVGQHGKIFTFYKFRTMIDGAEKSTGPIWAKNNDSRVTNVGNFLRRMNLDELPQLFNILKGDMYFVGPRPERPYFVKKFEKEVKSYTKRHDVKPGITGWAQVNGYCGNTSLKKRVLYDLYYVDHYSILFDIKILFKTFAMLFKNTILLF